MSGRETDRTRRGSGTGDGQAGQIQGAACGPVCAEAGACACDAEHGAVRPDAGVVVWAPVQCTLPVVERPGRVAEFDALFAAAVRGVQRPEPVRLRLVLDPAQEAAARDLAAREGDCCSFFSFVFAHNDDGPAWEIFVPEAQVPLLDVLAARAVAALEEVGR